MISSVKNDARGPWLLFGALLVLEFCLLQQVLLRQYAWIYPRWNDQIQYLTEAYTGYEYLRLHGFFPGLWQTLINPSAQGTLHDFFALIIFAVTGPSRGAALSINLFYLLAWQVSLFLAVSRTTRSTALALAAAGLVLAFNSPWWGGPGSIVDFRLDWMACCALGIALSLALCTDGFRSTRWSLAFGAAAGFVLLTRFLTGAYFVLIFAGLIGWCLTSRDRWARCGNLLLAALLAFALAAPVFWLNRDWVVNYYLIGHFTGPESAIRSPNMGIGRSLGWLGQNIWNLHIGSRWGWLVLAATLPLIVRMAWQRRSPQPLAAAAPTRSAGWGVLGLIFCVAPALVLTAHSQKSELVLSILLPGITVLVLGLWQGLAARSSRGTFPAIVSAGLIALGGYLAVRQLSGSNGDPGFIASARKVNDLAGYLYRTQRDAKLANPRVGVDQVTDSLDGQIMRVLCYEQQHVWVPFIMTLPTGIMEEKPELLMERLAQSDFMFMTIEMNGDGAWPYDKQMRRLNPQLKAWCEQNLKPVEAFPLFGRQMMLYQRRDLP